MVTWNSSPERCPGGTATIMGFPSTILDGEDRSIGFVVLGKEKETKKGKGYYIICVLMFYLHIKITYLYAIITLGLLLAPCFSVGIWALRVGCTKDRSHFDLLTSNGTFRDPHLKAQDHKKKRKHRERARLFKNARLFFNEKNTHCCWFVLIHGLFRSRETCFLVLKTATFTC